MTPRMMCAAMAATVALGSAVGSFDLAAQDIEAAARAQGIELPAVYYQRIQQDPKAFEFQRALFRRSSPAGTAAFGEVRLPVVLGLFADSEAEPHITTEMVQQSLFDGPSQRGTVTDSYLEMSRGGLTVTGDVIGWVRTALTISEVVGSNFALGPDARVGEWIVDMLGQVDDDVDFRQYDNDGPDGQPNSGDDDGFVDVITVEFLEVSASCGGPAIWPHRWTVQAQAGAPFETNDVGISGDPILVQDYITQSAADCSGDVVQDAGVIAHEFGHALGLPDYYHWVDRDLGPEGRRWVLGCWALMAAGSWGCGPVGSSREPYGPAHMIGHSKGTLGWLEYLDPGEVWNQEFLLDPAQFDGDVIRIPLDASATEFLFAEFRAQIGFDHGLPAAGVLLYKQDSYASLRPDPTTDAPYYLTMLEQDGNRGLLRITPEGGNRGEAGDAWGVDGVVGTLNAETNPPLRLRDGSWSPVTVHEVSVEGDVARLVISTGQTPRLVERTETAEVMQVRNFAVPVRIAGGHGPYEGVGTLPEGFSFQNIGDELFLIGSLREAGENAYSVAVRDRLGNTSPNITVTVNASSEWQVPPADLIEGFLSPASDPLTDGERSYLDDVGNSNGRFDVGDLRKWLRANDF
jgi:M6 family metalloprotease-like protein